MTHAQITRNQRTEDAPEEWQTFTSDNYMAGTSSSSLSGGSLIAKKYRLLGQIGEGSFGVIWQGKDVDSREQVAIKIESHSAQPKTLLEEARLITALHRDCENGTAVRI